MSILGIDVSTAQGRIDWQKVAGDGISFAFIKATEGLQTDPNHEARVAFFRANWGRAGQAGMKRGAYHFFQPNHDGHQQADLFLQQIQAVEAGELPPMVDVEAESGIPFVDRKTFVTRLSDCLSNLEDTLGVRPFVYTNTPYWNAHLDGSFGQYPLWIANYGQDQPTDPVAPAPRPIPLPHGFEDFVLWQFAEFGHVAGISGSGVDMDVFRGTLDELLGPGLMTAAITITFNGSAIADAEGFLSSEGLSFGWIRPIAAAIAATIFWTSAIPRSRFSVGHRARRWRRRSPWARRSCIWPICVRLPVSPLHSMRPVGQSPLPQRKIAALHRVYLSTANSL